MSTSTTQPPDAHGAKAQAKADKAYRKAMRPWFKKKRFIIPLILIVVILLASLAGGNGGQTQTSGTDQTQQKQDSSGAETTTAAIGQPARDGKFEFTVKKLESPGNSIGQSFAPQEAQGTWQLVHVDVKNIGTQAAMLDSSSQKAYDATGNEFSAQAVPSLKNFEKVFLNQINPGNSVKDAVIPFDVPQGTKLVKIKLHDSMFSGGVEVKLSK